MTPLNLDAQKIGYNLSAKDDGHKLGPFNFTDGDIGIKSTGSVAGPVLIAGFAHLNPHEYGIYCGHNGTAPPTNGVTLNNADVRCVARGLHCERLYNITNWTQNGGTLLYQNPNGFGVTLALKEGKVVRFNGVSFVGAGMALGPLPNDPDSYVLDDVVFTDCPIVVTSQYVNSTGHRVQSYMDFAANTRNIKFTGSVLPNGQIQRGTIEQKSAAPVLNFHGGSSTRAKPTNYLFINRDFVGGTALTKGDASGATFVGCTWNGHPV